MAVAFVDSVVGTVNSTGELTVNSVAPSGANRLLLVGIAWSDATATVSTVVFNGGESLTRLGGTANSSSHADIWYLVAPSAASGSVVITMANVAEIGGLCAGANWFTGVDQGTPLGTLSTLNGSVNPDPQPSLDISSAVDDLVFDTLGTDDSSVTIGAGQTSRHSTAGNNINNQGSTEPGASSVTMSWSALGNFQTYAYCAVNIKAAAAAAGFRPMFRGG